MLISPPPEEILRASNRASTSRVRPITRSTRPPPFAPSLLGNPSPSPARSALARRKRKVSAALVASPPGHLHAADEYNTRLYDPSTSPTISNPKPRKQSKSAVMTASRYTAGRPILSYDNDLSTPAPSSRRPSTSRKGSRATATPLPVPSHSRSTRRHSVTPLQYDPTPERFTPPREVLYTPLPPSLAPLSRRKSSTKSPPKGKMQRRLTLTIKKEPPDIDLTLPPPPPSPTDDPLLLYGRPPSRLRQSLARSGTSTYARDTPSVASTSPVSPRERDSERDAGDSRLKRIPSLEARLNAVDLSMASSNDDQDQDQSMSDDVEPPPHFDFSVGTGDDVDSDWAESGSDGDGEGEFDQTGEYTGRFMMLTVPTKEDPPSSATRERQNAWGRPVSPFPSGRRLLRDRGLPGVEDDEEEESDEEEEIREVPVGLTSPRRPLMPISVPSIERSAQTEAGTKVNARMRSPPPRRAGGSPLHFTPIRLPPPPLSVDSPLLLPSAPMSCAPDPPALGTGAGRREEEPPAFAEVPEPCSTLSQARSLPRKLVVAEGRQLIEVKPSTPRAVEPTIIDLVSPPPETANEVSIALPSLEEGGMPPPPLNRQEEDQAEEEHVFRELSREPEPENDDGITPVPAGLYSSTGANSHSIAQNLRQRPSLAESANSTVVDDDANRSTVAAQQVIDTDDDVSDTLDEGIVKITSDDPRAAARAAAVLKLFDYDCIPQIQAKNRRGGRQSVDSFIRDTRRQSASSFGINKHSSSERRRHTLGGIVGDKVFLPDNSELTLSELLSQAEAEVSFSFDSSFSVSHTQPRRRFSHMPPRTSGSHASSASAYRENVATTSTSGEWTKADWKRLDSCLTDERIAVGRRLGLRGGGLAPVEEINIEKAVDRFLVQESGIPAFLRLSKYNREDVVRRAVVLQKKQRTGKVAPPTPEVPRASHTLPSASPSFTERIKGLFRPLADYPVSLYAYARTIVPLDDTIFSAMQPLLGLAFTLEPLRARLACSASASSPLLSAY
ncbi:hypothetical protein WOLCODRAFT_165551 [Wolfiporia cocos MD-104 SS10]|uniref:Uncharacterized protein n=1 Tax=Wolfiporia cocos (strain MD-104) TaxID=742152 RepID=A0A2H3K1G3_WOLCO|nr:hypothetical protein WOLCODRAFT_165551 [Wolfiporia cocos MD-104 SS10]